VWSRNLVNEEAIAYWRLLRQIITKIKHVLRAEQELFVNKNGTYYWRIRNEIMTSRDKYKTSGIKDRVLRRLFVPKEGK
jgi:hypothetical protein